MSGTFFAKYATVTHSLKLDEEGAYCILEIPMPNECGFDIHIEVSSDEILMHCGDFHDHYPVEGEVDDFVNHFLGYLYDLLSPTMRLRVFTSGGKSYKWSLEGLENDEWSVEATTGVLLYNYFGKKEEVVLQNTTLEARADAYTNKQAEQGVGGQPATPPRVHD